MIRKIITFDMFDNLIQICLLQFKVYSLHYSGLLLKDFFLCEFFPPDFLPHQSQPHRVNLFILHRAEHASYPNQMDVLCLLPLCLAFQVQIHHLHALKERLF